MTLIFSQCHFYIKEFTSNLVYDLIKNLNELKLLICCIFMYH